jgi:GNAT superfamily N-acetyltransferase
MLLSNDFFDSPVCYFRRPLLHAAAIWLAKSEAIYFMVLQVSQQPVGFVFAHTLGHHLWRRFAMRHPHLFLDILWVLLRKGVLKHGRSARSRYAHARPHSIPEKVTGLRLPKTDTPFRWSRPDSHAIGYIDLFYIAEPYRGQGYGITLLDAVTQEMGRTGVRRVEAHIDSGNYASVRAFVKARWTVAETLTHDFIAYVEPRHAVS